MSARGRLVRIVHGVRDVPRVHPALERPVQHRVVQRQFEVAVGDGQRARLAAREGDRTDQVVALPPPGRPHRAGGREVRGPPVRLGPGGRGGAVGRDLAQRVVQAQGDRDQAVDGEQMRDHPGDRRTAAGRLVGPEPAQPHGRVPLGVPEVLQQRVQTRRLGVVRGRPAGDRDARRAALQAALQDPGAQGGVQVEALRRVQQTDGLAQPQRLVGAGSAVAEVRLHGKRLLRRTGGQRPRAEQGLQHRVRQDERRRPVQVGQGPAGVLDGGAGQRYAGRPAGAGARAVAAAVGGAAGSGRAGGLPRV